MNNVSNKIKKELQKWNKDWKTEIKNGNKSLYSGTGPFGIITIAS